MSILFALICAVAGTVGTFLFGIIGAGVALICAALSIVFAVKKRKRDGAGGIPSIVITLISVFFCGIITMLLLSMPQLVKDSAEKAGTQYIQNYADDFRFGVIGVVKHAEKDGVDMNVLSDEISKISDQLNAK